MTSALVTTIDGPIVVAFSVPQHCESSIADSQCSNESCSAPDACHLRGRTGFANDQFSHRMILFTGPATEQKYQAMEPPVPLFSLQNQSQSLRCPTGKRKILRSCRWFKSTIAGDPDPDQEDGKGQRRRGGSAQSKGPGAHRRSGTGTNNR